MEWRDEGIVLGTRRHGETSVILEVMTQAHGRHLGLVRGGRSRRLQPVLQAGNRLDLVWRARLDEHLGMFQVEAIDLNAARLLGQAASVYGLQLVAAHLRLLPERDPHARLFETLSVMLEDFEDAALVGEMVVRFELMVLDELGFGLDLAQCAATGRRGELAYVSPRTGRAVSREAGLPWHDRLLALPAFLGEGSAGRRDADAMDAAYRLTGHFFSRHVYEPRGIEMPEARSGLIATLRRALTQKAEGNDAA